MVKHHRFMTLVITLWFAILLLSSCSNSKQSLIDNACQEVERAWAYRDYYTPKYQTLKLKHWKSASEYFRELSAKDSGFARYASLSNQALNSKIRDYEEFYQLLDFCGVK
jgi:hypothetical protein